MPRSEQHGQKQRLPPDGIQPADVPGRHALRCFRHTETDLPAAFVKHHQHASVPLHRRQRGLSVHAKPCERFLRHLLPRQAAFAHLRIKTYTRSVGLKRALRGRGSAREGQQDGHDDKGGMRGISHRQAPLGIPKSYFLFYHKAKP